MKLKIGRGTTAAGKNRPQMFHGLQQRIRLATDRRRLFPAKSCSHRGQTLPQSAPQPIDRFQREGQPQFFRRRLERKSRQHFYQPPPHQRGRQRITRQYVSQDEGKCPPATAALPAIGTIHPLATHGLTTRLGRIVAQRAAVPVQTANAAAMRTRRLLEGKSWFFNSCASRTK